MYNSQIARALFVPIGAFVCWLFKGFKGAYLDQDTDKNEQRNLWIGILAFVIVVATIGIIKKNYKI